MRMMGYDFTSYDRQVKEIVKKNREESNPAVAMGIHDEQKLVPVISLVLYFGQEEWTGPRKLTGLLHFPGGYQEEIEAFLPDYHFNLVEVARLPGEVRKKFTSDFRVVADFAASQKDARLRKKFLEDNERKIDHPGEVLDVLGSLGRDKRYQAIRERIVIGPALRISL